MNHELTNNFCEQIALYCSDDDSTLLQGWTLSLRSADVINKPCSTPTTATADAIAATFLIFRDLIIIINPHLLALRPNLSNFVDSYF